MGTSLTGALNASGRKKLQFPTDISLLAHKRSKIDGYMRLTSIESSFHPCNTLTAIVPGAHPGEANMCLRLIAETDARSVGDIAILFVLFSRTETLAT